MSDHQLSTHVLFLLKNFPYGSIVFALYRSTIFARAMVTRSQKHIFIFIRILFSFLLVGVFITFYFYDQVRDFAENRTTVAIRTEEAESIEHPTLTFCMDPGTKTSVAKEYGYQSFSDIFFKDIPNTTLFQRFDNLSYTLNDDFEIMISDQKLKIGITEVHERNSTLMFDTNPLRTYFFGTCYKVQPMFEINDHPFGLFWIVTLKVNKEIDKPRGISLFLTSNETWKGIAHQSWPKFNPAKANFLFENDFYKLQFRSIKLSYENGVENTSQCLSKIPVPCTFFSDRISNHSICEKYEDVQTKNTNYTNCFRLLQATTYSFDQFQPQNYQKPNSSWLLIRMDLLSMEQEVREEIPVITSQSLIGSIGGSLGMFFGFSILSTFNMLLQKIFN